MTSRRDLYAVLGITADADVDEIAAAFRARAKELHPDLADDDGERFKELSHAYHVLMHPDHRRRYDQARRTDLAQPPPRGAPIPRSPVAAPVPFLGTVGRARAARWVGIGLVVIGTVLAVVVPFLGDAPHGSTLGRDITLWIAAAKFVVGGAILAVFGQHRLRELLVHRPWFVRASTPGSS